jgi:hypothetical protein
MAVAKEGMKGRNKTAIYGLACLAISAASRDAAAYPFYFDVQGGAAELTSTSIPIFNGAGGSSSFGIGGGFGLFYTPIEPHGGVDFQIGIQTLTLFPTQGSNYYGILAPYPAVRLQLLMLYATFGLTPFVWQRSQVGPGVDFFSQAPNTLGYLGEFGILYPATPKFSMGGGLSMQYFSTSGVINTSPALSIHFVMRFYFNLFGIGQDGPAEANPLEYKGWRYIGK